jgi:uncharacterized HAD superfamily protein
MKKRTIRIGLDFDGVVAYNPFRIIRAPITYVKRHVFKIRKLTFYVPKSPIERFVWTIVHESSMFPAIGIQRLKEMAAHNNIEFHLVTARFHFLQQNVDNWLKRNGLTESFTGLHLNIHDKQPHIHKLEMIEELQLDYFVEDNWDIVSFVNGKTKSKIFWIYNITDSRYQYQFKYPYLDKALIDIQKQIKM